ncbi:Ubiquitin-specific protease incomplete domain containing protein [Pandoravirus dulcis]|uniref:Ubiquitin-specific protease incomplete domain containing protein n=1 Tax=Pandoravirus dulcis TaxID=1349409 RepID=S4VUC4_9VIRU|nr:Ubiquitin-specific protease incomplete domain containing protein [Pandoravirus dulcis]AGO82990.1 Ubiquitin-specific protease incomplete domain containing protein [Pandoravirus dulcis]
MDSATRDSADGAGSVLWSAAAPVLVVFNARGTYASTTATTLASAPAGSLLCRIGASARACDSTAPSCQADGSYFVDVNALWLSVAIDYLAHGVVTAPKMTPGVLAGVQAAADYLGLGALALECAARLARSEATDAPPDHTFKVHIITAADRHAHTGALDVFSRYVRNGADSPLSVALLGHHPMNVVGHIVRGVLGRAESDVVFYVCWARRNTTLRPLAPLDMTSPTTLLGDCWAAKRNREMWLYAVEREPPVDLVPLVSCGPSMPIGPPTADVPVLVFVKVFNPLERYLGAPRHTFVASTATVGSALPALLDVVSGDSHIGDVDIAVYEEANKTNAYRVDLDTTFAQAEIEPGDVLWLCPRAAALAPRIALADYDWIVSPGGPQW